MAVGPTVRSASACDVWELGRRAPAWVPDTASTACQQCTRTFSFLVRRHHCRACGRLLCATCCGQTCPLQYLHWAPARVCLACKQQLDGPSHSLPRSRSFSGMAEEAVVAQLLRQVQLETHRRRTLSGPDEYSTPLEQGGGSHVLRLPPEVVAKIFDQLPHSDKMACRAVCHRWLQAVEVSRFHKENFIHLEAGQQEALTDILTTYCLSSRQFQSFKFSELSLSASLPLWGGLGLNLRILELHSCQVGEKDLVAILGQAQQLHTLALVNCRETFMSGNFLAQPAELAVAKESLANLRSLCLDTNKYLSDVLLLRISQTTPVLEHLSLSDCNLMNDAGIYRKHYPASQQIAASPSVLTWRIVVGVVRSLATTLTSLDVSRNSGVDLELLSNIEGLSLRNVNLTNCNAVTQEGFRRLAAANPALGSVNLAGCRRVLAGHIEMTRNIFTSLGQQLTSLNLSNLSVAHFSEVGALRHLEQLVLDNLDAPGGEIIAGLQGLDLGRLVILQARYLALASRDLAELMAGKEFPRMRSLDLSHGCENVITDEVLLAICSSMRWLTHLNLAGNPLLSDVGALGLEALGAVVEPTVNSSPLDEVSSVSRPGLSQLNKLVFLDLSSSAVSEKTLHHGIVAPDLRQLALNQCNKVVDGGLYSLAARHPRLERLELRSCLLTDTGLVSSLSCLPRLVYVDLSCCGYITSSGLKALEQVAPQLQTLLISNCPNVSVEAARSLETSMPSLKRLETHGLERERMVFSSYMKPIPPAPPPPPPLPP